MIELNTPILDGQCGKLIVGDVVSISGYIYTGRDAVLPKIVEAAKNGGLEELGIDLKGSVIFHTAVSPAGLGPTSSNKVEIESTFAPLAKAGVKLFLGKGAISAETIRALEKYNAVFAVIPPVTALLESQTQDREVIAFPELGMEAFHRIKVCNYQAVVAAAKGRSIYE